MSRPRIIVLGIFLISMLAACSGSPQQLVPGHQSSSIDDAAAAAAAAKSIWSVVSSPDEPPIDSDLYDDLLYNASGTSASDVWSAGWYCCASYGSQEYDRTVIEHWNGSVWSIIPSAPNEPANSQLRGVAAVASNDAWVFGMSFNSGQPLIEHWNGTAWSLTANPYVSKGWLLAAQAFASDDVWAVGTASNSALTEHWNGKSWSVVANPSGSGPGGTVILNAVSGSSPNDVWAVGEFDHPDPNVFAEHWNGRQWSSVKPVNKFYYSDFYAVAAVSPNDVWAVGDEYPNPTDSHLRQLIEHWDGASWSIVPSPNKEPKGPYKLSNVLSAVTAVSADDVWAGGYWTSADSNIRALFVHWDGKRWKAEPGPSTLEKNGNGSFSQILGFANLGGGMIWATGYQSEPAQCCDETLTMKTTHG
ncbi:MAG: hypothetical protein JOZ77_12365 [Candidatus Eremiobacteraeota bacterium]|nr:hypothetical protein [Candidatus Eremiobacteraeota bacterium]